MSETYMERKVQQQAQTINEMISVLEICAKVVDQHEVVQMCHDAISKARGNV